MKRLNAFIILIVFTTGGLFAQNGIRYSLGTKILTVHSQDAKYKVFGPGGGNWAPSFLAESSLAIYETDKFSINLNYALGLTSVGYKYAYSPDSVTFFKASGTNLSLGLELSYDVFETEETIYPISLVIAPQISMLLLQKVGLNNQVTYFDLDEPQGGLGGMSKVDFVFFDNYDFKLSTFYRLDWYYQKGIFEFSNKALYRTHHIGIAISFENWYF